MQKTLANPIELHGRGIFTGLELKIRISPHFAGRGIVFRRIDLSPPVEIPLDLKYVQESSRCTCIGFGDVKIMMVEHLLSALHALNIDQAEIEVDGPEIPGFDGSSIAIVQAIKLAGVRMLQLTKNVISVTQPVYLTAFGATLVAVPSDDFQISYTLHYPKSKVVGSQFFSCRVSEGFYIEQIAPCRTFSIYEEVLPFLEKGLIKGGGLDNAIVVKEDHVVNPEGLRFSDEFVRHKVLDLIGDLSFMQAKIKAHIIAICSGHASNIAFAKQLLETFQPRSVSCQLVL